MPLDTRTQGHSDEVLDVAFNASGSQLVSASADGRAIVWGTLFSDDDGAEL